MEKDYVMEAVFDFMENGGELPAEASKNPHNRFLFQSAMMRMTYKKSCVAIDEAGKAKSLSVGTAKDMETFGKVVDSKMAALVDKVNVRLGLVGGFIVIANIALVIWS